MRLWDWLLGRRETLHSNEPPDPEMIEVRQLATKVKRREEQLTAELRRLETDLRRHR